MTLLRTMLRTMLFSPWVVLFLTLASHITVTSFFRCEAACCLCLLSADLSAVCCLLVSVC
jgi:hypothetical protein